MSEFESYNWGDISYPITYMRSLFDYARQHPFKNGLEIGFDQGASALAFLRACPEARILSIDIALCGVGNARLRTSEVTSRFSFRYGDSREVLPSMGDKFDMIYVDGDHLYDVAFADIENAIGLLELGGYIIVDDADPSHSHFGVGRAVDAICTLYGFDKEALIGSSSSAVILRKI